MNPPEVHIADRHLAHLFVFVFLVLTLAAPGARAEEFFEAAHAHNDYAHQRPLLDALDHGFCGVEADVFLVGDKLLVGHYRFELRADRTLQSLYLDPLRKRVTQRYGRVYADGPTIMLLIDIKNKGIESYALLSKVLMEYQELFEAPKSDPTRGPAVQVVLSGGRPFNEIKADKRRLCGIDGRVGDLDSTEPANLIPLISDNWTSQFSYRGDGEMPAEEREKLHSIVTKAHAAGRRVRFWGTPEHERLWEELVIAGVDHINTDKLDRLRSFFRSRSAPAAAP